MMLLGKIHHYVVERDITSQFTDCRRGFIKHNRAHYFLDEFLRLMPGAYVFDDSSDWTHFVADSPHHGILIMLDDSEDSAKVCSYMFDQ